MDGKTLYPLPKFRFNVTWGDDRVGFTEVTGLEIQFEPIEYREGCDKASSKKKMPGMKKFSNVTLKRGMTARNSGFYNWPPEQRRTLVISLLDEADQPVMKWKVLNAFPVKIQASDLKAEGNEVAIETLEVGHEDLSIMLD